MTTPKAPTRGYKVGVNLPNVLNSRRWKPQELASFAQRAETLGFDTLVVSDHMVWNQPVIDPLLTLSYVAGVTTTVNLCVGVYLAAMRHPVLTAKLAGSLSYLSDDRFILGVGVGGEHPTEWEAVGANVHDRGRRTDEILEILNRLLGTDAAPLTHRGRHYQLTEVSVEPRGSSTVPIWIGGRSRAGMHRAASYGGGWFPNNLTPPKYADAADQIRQGRKEVQRDAPFTFAFSLPILIDNDKSRALATVDRYFRGLYGEAGEKFLPYCAVGSQRVCAETIESYVEAGAEQVILQPIGIETDATLEVIRGAIYEC